MGRIPMKATTYDGIVLALVCLEDTTYVKNHGMFPALAQFIMCLILHLVNVGTQFTLIYLLLVTTTKKETIPFKHGTQPMIEELRVAMEANPVVRLSPDSPAVAGCLRNETLPVSHLFVQFIWASRMSLEIVDALWRLLVIFKLPIATHSDLLNESPDGKVVLAHSTCKVKALSLILGVIPQMVVGVFLWWTGAKFLFFAL